MSPVKWAVAVGAGPAGLAHRVLGDELELLGKHFDIHGGGMDLQFPHHENEIAQSEGRAPATLRQLLDAQRFRAGRRREDVESLGNFFTIREVLKNTTPEVVRFFILRAHYRSPLNYSDAHLDDARQALTRLYTALRNVPAGGLTIDWSAPLPARFARRWTTTSTPPGRSPCCSIWPTNRSTAASRPAPRALAEGAGRRAGPAGAEPSAFLQARCRRRRRSGRGHRGADRGRDRRQEGEEFRRGRPHPR